MKTLTTLIFVLLIGFTAQAKDAREAAIQTEITTTVLEVQPLKETEVARLYRSKHSLVKKELSFATKRNAARLV